ncbi:MAG: ribonuclease H-like domain-containing protein [Promethearchaeota archaeon]
MISFKVELMLFYLQKMDFPDDFIERSIRMYKKEDDLSPDKSERSTYHEYTEENIWNETLLDDIYITSKAILDYVINCNSLKDKPYFGKKIVSIDIETTTWIPKAFEGFVNILGASILDLRYPAPADAELIVYQSFNMLRKKEKAFYLLNLAQKYINNADIIIVFNKNFDIKILKTIIKNFKLDYKFPEEIIDMMGLFKSLAALESHLSRQVNFQRIHSEKGQYQEYYKSFKGKGKKGTGKQIDPIGVYNLMDTLTPLYAFLLMDDFSRITRGIK